MKEGRQFSAVEFMLGRINTMDEIRAARVAVDKQERKILKELAGAFKRGDFVKFWKDVGYEPGIVISVRDGFVDVVGLHGAGHCIFPEPANIDLYTNLTEKVKDTLTMTLSVEVLDKIVNAMKKSKADAVSLKLSSKLLEERHSMRAIPFKMLFPVDDERLAEINNEGQTVDGIVMPVNYQGKKGE